MIEFKIEYAAKLFVPNVPDARQWLVGTLGAKNERKERAIYIGGIAYKLEKGELVDPGIVQLALRVERADFDNFLNYLVRAGCEVLHGREDDNEDRGYRVLKSPPGFGIHVAWRADPFAPA